MTASSTIREVIIPLLTGLAGFTAAYFAFLGVEKQTDAALVSTLYEQVRELEQRLFERESENTKLRIALEKKYESSDVLRNFINRMPFPAWIKVVEIDDEGKTSFKMWHINGEYERRYNLTLERYAGKRDDEVWKNPETWKSFYANDLQVLQSMNHRCRIEKFPTKALQPASADNPLVEGFVCKWPTRVNGRTAIAGMLYQKGMDIVR